MNIFQATELRPQKQGLIFSEQYFRRTWVFSFKIHPILGDTLERENE